MELREEFLRAYLGALTDLRVLTVGLSKIASEEAAKAVLAARGIAAEGPAADALRKLYSLLGAEAEVSAGEHEVEVRVRHPCPLSWPGCEELCPLPHISSVYLSALGRWYPKRVGMAFVEVAEGACRFTLVRVEGGEREGGDTG